MISYHFYSFCFMDSMNIFDLKNSLFFPSFMVLYIGHNHHSEYLINFHIKYCIYSLFFLFVYPNSKMRALTCQNFLFLISATSALLLMLIMARVLWQTDYWNWQVQYSISTLTRVAICPAFCGLPGFWAACPPLSPDVYSSSFLKVCRSTMTNLMKFR